MQEYFAYEEVKLLLSIASDEYLDKKIARLGIEPICHSGEKIICCEDFKKLEQEALLEGTIERADAKNSVENLYKALHDDDYFVPIMADIDRDLTAGEAKADTKTELVGDWGTIAHYRILRSLGEGASAEVFLGEDKDQPGVKYAIKKLRDTVNDEKLVKRFIQGAQVNRRVNHEHIAALKEVGYCKANNTIYLAMEYVPGGTLAEIMEVNTLSEKNVFTIAYAMTLALQYLCSQGVIHRDIKPANILVGNDFFPPKLTDLGLAKNLNDSLGLTGSSQMLGTIRYMSPEQCLSSKNLDTRSDIYSLGATLYHAISGKAPYEEIKSPIQVAQEKQSRDPLPLCKANPEVSRRAEAIVKKAMARNLKKRYQRPEEMLKAITASGLMD